MLAHVNDFSFYISCFGCFCFLDILCLDISILQESHESFLFSRIPHTYECLPARNRTYPSSVVPCCTLLLWVPLKCRSLLGRYYNVMIKALEHNLFFYNKLDKTLMPWQWQTALVLYLIVSH